MSDEVWIGLDAKSEDDQLVWADGSELEWDIFAEGKGPDNNGWFTSAEECVAIDQYEGVEWLDYQCDSSLL